MCAPHLRVYSPGWNAATRVAELGRKRNVWFRGLGCQSCRSDREAIRSAQPSPDISSVRLAASGPALVETMDTHFVVALSDSACSPAAAGSRRASVTGRPPSVGT